MGLFSFLFNPFSDKQKEEIKKVFGDYDLNKKISHDEFIKVMKTTSFEVDEEKMRNRLKSKDKKGEEGLVDLKTFFDKLIN